MTVTLPSNTAGYAKLMKHAGAGWSDISQAPGVTFTPGSDTFTITLTDGGAWDADGLVNGVIQDPVGPAENPADIPTLGEWAVLVALTLLAGLAITRLRRRAPTPVA